MPKWRYRTNDKERTIYTYDGRGNLILEEYAKSNGNRNPSTVAADAGIMLYANGRWTISTYTSQNRNGTIRMYLRAE